MSTAIASLSPQVHVRLRLDPEPTLGPALDLMEAEYPAVQAIRQQILERNERLKGPQLRLRIVSCMNLMEGGAGDRLPDPFVLAKFHYILPDGRDGKVGHRMRACKCMLRRRTHDTRRVIFVQGRPRSGAPVPVFADAPPTTNFNPVEQQVFHECQTAILDNVCNPTWNQLFEFQMPSSLTDVRLKITVGDDQQTLHPHAPPSCDSCNRALRQVWDYDLGGFSTYGARNSMLGNDFYGQVSIDLKDTAVSASSSSRSTTQRADAFAEAVRASRRVLRFAPPPLAHSCRREASKRPT